MKKLALWSLILTVSILSTVVLAADAEHVDPVKAAPDHYKVMMENERVRVLEFHGKGGDKIPAHWHPDHVVYMVAGGKANFTVDGKTKEEDLKTGVSAFIPSQTHATELLGTGDFHVIIVELK